MTTPPGAHRSDFVVRCACGISYKTDDAHLGQRIKCRCGQRVTVVRPAGEPGARASQSTRSRRRAASSDRATQDRATQVRSTRWPRWRTPLRTLDRTTAQWIAGVIADIGSDRRALRWTARAAWGWSVLVLAAWVLLITTSERFVPATILAYGPRFGLLLPFVVLVPLAAVFARRAAWPLLLALLMVLGPIMGGRVSLATLGRAMPERPSAGQLRVVTLNAQGGRSVAWRLREFIESMHPDLLAFQECGDVLWDSLQALPGWHHARHASLCTASRWRIASGDSMPRADFERISQYGFGGTGLAVRYVLSSPRGPFQFVNLHLETARKGLDALVGEQGLVPDDIRSVGEAVPDGDVARGITLNAAIRDRESSRAAVWSIRGDKRVPTVIVGDFNLPVESTIYRRHWGDFIDAFEARGNGFGWTKREGSLLRVRIDHILGTDASPQPVGAWVGPHVGSDHRPVIADLAWQRP